MKLEYVIAVVVHICAGGLVRLFLWISTLQIGLPEGIDPQVANNWFNVTSLTVFMWLTIRYTLHRLRKKDERIVELTDKLIEIIEKQTDFINKTLGEVVHRK